MEEYPAHIKYEGESESKEILQTVQAHCRRTADYAASCLRSIGLEHAAYLAGLVHDCGKYTKKFSDYIRKAARGEAVQRGAVNHTFAGVRLLLEHFHANPPESYGDMTAELLAYAAGAHHGQFDCINEKGMSGFLHRLRAEEICYPEAKENFLKQCVSWPELEALFEEADRELLPIYEKIQEDQQQQMFCLGQLARLLLSAVIEGDRRDTAEFMDAAAYPARDCGRIFWMEHLQRVEKKLSGFPQDTPICAARGQFSAQCRAAAERQPGIYRLNIPTGGGKTLSALRFALAHAGIWEKKRIIFVTPLLTILEQNAAVIRTYLGDDSIILEHHSNVLNIDTTPEALDLRELAVNSWESPVIITTLVQLLNTMFLGKTTSIRRYQALCDAVVVIDEVQTVPNNMLSLFNTAVNFLSSVCGTTFLLCSATQPCFERAEHPLHLGANAELIPYQEALWRPFKRTTLCDAGAMRQEEIPGWIETILPQVKSLLIICNMKKEAEFLYRHLSSGDRDCFHLSSAMCMANRRAVLHMVECSLEKNKNTDRKTICVSTQVMEAGVDISFGCVLRLTAGMDSVVQAAGRCNRNGESEEPAPVYLLQCADENLGRLREIREGKEATIALLNCFRRHPEQFGGDISSDQAVRWYYQCLFDRQRTTEGYQQFTESGYVLYDLLSWNDEFADEEASEAENYLLRQAFKTAGELFRVMDDSAEDVVVPYGEGQKLIRELEQYPKNIGPGVLKDWSKRARPYTISIYQYQKEKLSAALCSVRGVLVLEPECYSEETGLLLNWESGFLEV